MAGRHHEVVPSKDQQGVGQKNPGPPIRSNCERPGCERVKHGSLRPLHPGSRGVNSRQATDLVTWYYQDLQPHYPGMMAAGEGSRLAFGRIYSSDIFSLHSGPLVDAFPHVESSQVSFLWLIR